MRAAGATLLACALAGPVTAETVDPACYDRITAARYTQPTTRYAHGVFGEDEEWGGLATQIALAPGCAGAAVRVEATLPQNMVFEDLAPRLADVDGDGRPEVVVVETRADQGARLAVWGLTEAGVTRRAATPYIGQTRRWLAPVAIADLDGDGAVELAYVDRPHLAKTLRVWRWAEGGLTEVAALPGVSNHRFGVPTIDGGLRDCGAGPEMVLADAAWRRIVAVTLTAGRLTQADLGPYSGSALARALDCRAP